jgi:hypothetical protein
VGDHDTDWNPRATPVCVKEIFLPQGRAIFQIDPQTAFGNRCSFAVTRIGSRMRRVYV